MNKSLILLSMLVIVSCSLFKSSNTKEQLELHTWTVYYLNGSHDLHENTITLLFKEGTLTGRSSCNNYFVPYSVNDDKITIVKAIGATKKMCENESMELEKVLFNHLAEINTFSIKKEELWLKNSQGEIIIKAKK